MNRYHPMILRASAMAGLVLAFASTSPAGEPEEAAKTSLFGDTQFAKVYDDLKAQKDAAGIPITLGAWHWFRVSTGAPGGEGYGIPGLRDTYYWYLNFDPKMKLNGDCITEIGLHTEIRARENGTFRPFIEEQVWPWEVYGYADTAHGKFKAGQIWKRLGLDWDGVFYGNTPYFDGYKLDPDLGVSWEYTFTCNDSFKVDTIAQFFIQEDGINGSISGADAESTNRIREENTFVIRVVPTWTLCDESTLALGLSGSVGNLENNLTGDETFTAWGTDLTYAKGNFKVFGEVLQSHGTINPTRYVSGGPSDKITNYLVGTSYKTGPFTWRANYSAGYDSNPDGKQSLFLPGVTVALTDNVDLYCEHVKWDVKAAGGPKAVYEDGLQFALNWRF